MLDVREDLANFLLVGTIFVDSRSTRKRPGVSIMAPIEPKRYVALQHVRYKLKDVRME